MRLNYVVASLIETSLLPRVGNTRSDSCRFQLLQLCLHLGPGFGVALRRIRRIRLGKKVQKLRLDIRSGASKFIFRQLIQQFRVSFIIQTVFSRTGVLADVEIIVGQIQPFLAQRGQEFTIVVERGVETGLEHLFGLWRRRPELENLERTELGNQLEQKGQKTFSRTGLAIVLAPF